MSTPHPPRPKSLVSAATGPRVAQLAAVPAGVGEPKGVAEGVPTAVRPEPQPVDGRYFVAWLHVVAPRGGTPTATSKCACGRDRSAVGRDNVRDLVHEHDMHRENCPLRSTTEEREAA
ncbi:hypothetical protein [Streptomyces sp. NPDC005408]|uniref:hypothetical protein n=1 Tax=Streptomyces sp. NPDC005408 TaxID=3155341 RepID=UPI0033B15C16